MTKQILSILMSFSVVLSGCSNVFEKFAVKDTDAALYEDATKALNAGNYDLSLEKFNALSAGYKSNPDVKKYWAGALAGKCGMDFTSLLDSLTNADLSSTAAFKFFMNLFTGKTVHPEYCTQAETQMKEIWGQRSATQGEQLFMVLLSMAKMGTYLRSKADNDGAGNLGDGNTDAGYNSCNNTDDDHHLTDAEVTEVVTGFSQLLLNITAFTATTFAGSAASINNIQAACAAFTPNPCATTDAASVDASMIATMRDLLETNGTYPTPIGIGSCSFPTPPGSCCP